MAHDAIPPLVMVLSLQRRSCGDFPWTGTNVRSPYFLTAGGAEPIGNGRNDSFGNAFGKALYFHEGHPFLPLIGMSFRRDVAALTEEGPPAGAEPARRATPPRTALYSARIERAWLGLTSAKRNRLPGASCAIRETSTPMRHPILA